MEYGVIMAGGSGTRLWPMSRESRPKQLLPVVGGKSLLRVSYERFAGLIPPERILVCTGSQHRELILQDLPELKKENLLGEPMGRDTANAVGLPAAVLAKRDPEAVFAIVTADHVIEPIPDFQASMRLGFDLVAKHPKALVTFGILPTHGHTGLGYIHRGEIMEGQNGSFKVQAFKEKPNKADADRYVESGKYYWNSGMFVWRAQTVLDELGQHLPDSLTGLKKIQTDWDTPKQEETLKAVYPTLPKISIDYAVMEPASQKRGAGEGVYVVEMRVNWLDVGSWPALAETLHVDDKDNATSAPVLAMIDSENNIIISEDPKHLVGLIGVSDMVIVHTKNATMICPKNESQRVKELVALVKDKHGSGYL